MTLAQEAHEAITTNKDIWYVKFQKMKNLLIKKDVNYIKLYGLIQFKAV